MDAAVESTGFSRHTRCATRNRSYTEGCAQQRASQCRPGSDRDKASACTCDSGGDAIRLFTILSRLQR
jgi:hypothetical protein